MKEIGMKDAKEHLSEVVRLAQNEAVILRNHGRVSAVVIGLEGTDPEDAILAELHRRRVVRSRLLSGDEVSRALGLDPEQEAHWRAWGERQIAKSKKKR